MVAYYLDYETGQILGQFVFAMGERTVKINGKVSTPIRTGRGEWFQYKSKAKEVGLSFFNAEIEKQKERILRFYTNEIRYNNSKKEKVAIEFGVYKKCLQEKMRSINQAIERLLLSYNTNY